MELTLGITGEKFDFMLPAHIPLASITAEIIRKMEQYLPSIMIDKKSPILLNQDTMKALPYDLSLSASGIRDGSRLMIV